MIEYPKIETVYDRNPADMKHVILGDLRDPAFGLVDRWLVTEKVDGMNVRVILEDGKVRFGGRTDDAQMPLFLLDRLAELLPAEQVSAAFDPGTKAVVFGEGYGPKIQKGGGDYAAEPSFVVFDVAVVAPDRVWWLNWRDVIDVARKLNVPHVPILAANASIEDALKLVTCHSKIATVNERRQEGIVCRTDPLLFTRSGHRLVWKLKERDLP